MPELLKSCLECGEISDQARCQAHRVARVEVRADHRADTTATAWKNLSIRARRIQPYCTGCGTEDQLQADHSPRAWARMQVGKPVRLCDVTVLCARCNSSAGSSKPDSDRYRHWIQDDGDLSATTPDPTALRWGGGVGRRAPSPHSKAKFESHCESFSVRGEG